MAKLTESYLRNMIKQVMNEMTPDKIRTASLNYGGTAGPSKYSDNVVAAANEYDTGGDLEETAKHYGIDPIQLRQFLDEEQELVKQMYTQMDELGVDELAESRRRRMAPKRK